MAELEDDDDEKKEENIGIRDVKLLRSPWQQYLKISFTSANMNVEHSINDGILISLLLFCDFIIGDMEKNLRCCCDDDEDDEANFFEKQFEMII